MDKIAYTETDVIIIGSGMAGLAAACEAADHGARAVVLEKMNYIGGNSAIAGGGYAAWDSSLKLRQELGLGEDSWQAHVSDTVAAGGGENLPELVEVLAKGAPEGLDWLVDKGVQFKKVLAKLGGYSAPRSYQAASSGKEIMDMLAAAARKRGVDIFTGCRVERFLKDASGRISGLCFSDGDGERCISAKRGIVIASGGFSRDVELRAQYCPELTDKVNCSNHHGATGEVIRAAQEAGADTLHMSYIQLYPCANPVSGSVDRWAFYLYSGAGFGMLYVNSEGRRFISEMASRDSISQAMINSCQKPCWAIMDSAIVRALGMSEDDVNTGLRLKRMISADSIAELAGKIGADAAVLADAVEESRAAIARGETDAVGRPYSETYIPIESAPFYAVAQWPSVHYTMGGLRIDARARVLDPQGKPIPGLYAAGEVCGGVHGKNRMGGNALAECVVFGRIAGEMAAGSL